LLNAVNIFPLISLPAASVNAFSTRRCKLCLPGLSAYKCDITFIKREKPVRGAPITRGLKVLIEVIDCIDKFIIFAANNLISSYSLKARS
jgi:hypothetical protein